MGQLAHERLQPILSRLHVALGGADVLVTRRFPDLVNLTALVNKGTLACPVSTGVERLTVLRIAVSPVRLEQAAASIREHQGAMPAVQWHMLNQPLLLEVAQIGSLVVRGITWVPQVARRHHPKRTDRRQRSRVGTFDRVIAVTLMNQFPVTAVRQVEIAHEHVARVEAAAIVVTATRVTIAVIPPVLEVTVARVVLHHVITSVASARSASQHDPFVLAVVNAIVQIT